MLTFRTPLIDAEQSAQLWKQKYLRKREDKFHNLEDKRLTDLAFTKVGAGVIIKEFMKHNRPYLDPPEELKYFKLLAFLHQAKPHILDPASAVTERTILLDDRKDPNSMPGATRDWDDDTENGYFKRPPKGIESNIYFEQLSTSEFVQRVTSATVRFSGVDEMETDHLDRDEVCLQRNESCK
jgi:hypothetical protein